jgi:hypothetical protein
MENDDVVKMLRTHIPLPGSGWTYLWNLEVKPGSEVGDHYHHHWVACVHELPVDGDPHIELIVDGHTITPAHGEVTVIPPYTMHSVPVWRGKHSRRTHALAVDVNDDRQCVKTVVR